MRKRLSLTELRGGLIEYVMNKGACPMPGPWKKLWDMLPCKIREGDSWKPGRPLILAAWYEPVLAKALRFEEHLKWADEHGVLDEVSQYLDNLPDSDWYKGN